MAEELGVKPRDGAASEDSYFDALLPITANGEGKLPISIIDNNATYYLNLKANDPLPTIDPKPYIIDGNLYTFYVTSTRSSDADIAFARKEVEDPKNGVAIYLHYDLEEEVMGYKVEFAKGHFGDLDAAGREEVRLTFKKGIANLVEAYQAIKAVDDWSGVLYKLIKGLNESLKEAVATLDLPKGTWYSKDEEYPNYDEHIEPIIAGVIDGSIEEVTGIPQLINVVVDFTTNEETRNEMIKVWNDLDIQNEFSKWIDEKWNTYTGNEEEKYHAVGKDGITVTVAVVTGGASTVKSVKKGVEYVKELAERIKKGKIGNPGGDLLSNLKTRFANKFDDIQWQKFEKDFGDFPDLLKKFDDSPKLVDSWKLLEDAKVDDAVRKNIDELTKVSDNLPSIKRVGSYKEWRKMDDLFKSRKLPDLATLRKMAQKYLDFTTKADGAVFWSGPRMADAQKWARNSGRNTLEQTIGGKYLDELSLFSPSSGMSGSEAAEIWDIASKSFAEKASGTLNVFSTGAEEVGDFGQRTWWRIEKPTLLKNSKVIRIIRRNKDGSISKTGHIDVNPK